MPHSVRQLFLLRHAKSSWDDPDLADHERPLAPRGLRASRLIAEHLAGTGIAPALVICSTATRARETLEAIQPSLGDEFELRIEPRVYAASAGELLELLRELDDDLESAMLVGHNPGIENLAVELAGRGERLGELRAKFPTAALATLEFPGDWPDLRSGRAELLGFVKPRELEPPG
jgi:phosphohistidine phosphatase